MTAAVAADDGRMRMGKTSEGPRVQMAAIWSRYLAAVLWTRDSEKVATAKGQKELTQA
jgi:hypothetical protein